AVGFLAGICLAAYRIDVAGGFAAQVGGLPVYAALVAALAGLGTLFAYGELRYELEDLSLPTRYPLPAAGSDSPTTEGVVEESVGAERGTATQAIDPQPGE